MVHVHAEVPPDALHVLARLGEGLVGRTRNLQESLQSWKELVEIRQHQDRKIVLNFYD